MCLNQNFYPELIKEFYANLEYRSTSSTLTSKVNNVLISISIPELRNLLNLPSENLVQPPILSNTWTDFVDFDNKSDLNKLLSNSARAPIREPPDYNKMNLNSRIMQNLITYNILPHSGSKTYVTRYGSYLIHCLHSEVRLDLAVLIFRHMVAASEKARTSLPYPSLLTLIFQHYNVGLRGQLIEQYTPHDLLDAPCIKKMNYKFVNEEANTWIHKSGEPDIHDGDWDPNTHEAPTAAPSTSLPSEPLSTPFPEHPSSSQSWESRIYDLMQANQEEYRANYTQTQIQHQALMGSLTSLSDSFTSFHKDTMERFNYIDDRFGDMNERFGELHDKLNPNNDDDDDGGDATIG